MFLRHETCLWFLSEVYTFLFITSNPSSCPRLEYGWKEYSRICFEKGMYALRAGPDPEVSEGIHAMHAGTIDYDTTE